MGVKIITVKYSIQSSTTRRLYFWTHEHNLLLTALLTSLSPFLSPTKLVTETQRHVFSFFPSFLLNTVVKHRQREGEGEGEGEWILLTKQQPAKADYFVDNNNNNIRVKGVYTCIRVEQSKKKPSNKHCFVSFLEIKSSFPLSLHDLYQVQVFHLSRYLQSIYFSWVFFFI